MHLGHEHNGGSARHGESIFASPRDFLDNKYVYAVITPRARGLSIGVNCCPDKRCNFDCIYCEVNRSAPGAPTPVNLDQLSEELHRTLNHVHGGGLNLHPRFAGVLPELLQLKHVTISGDGEPTASPQFLEIVQTAVHVRAMTRVPFFKFILVTNSSCLDTPQVQEALQFFTKHDEVWAKLDGGTQQYVDRINIPGVSIEKILENILVVARQRPVIIQTLFPMLDDNGPSSEEVDAYAKRLNDLKHAGAKISEVQIYSATRPQSRQQCGHLPLRHISRIASTVRTTTGLKVEIY